MAKGMYHYIREQWKKPHLSGEFKQRLVEWRKGNAVVRVEKPLRLDRARALGYKAKQGFVVARVKLVRGGRKRPAIRSGRRSKRMAQRKTLMLSYQTIAEQRAARKFINLEVLNSYWIGEDGVYCFYEVIMIDPNHPQIRNDPDLKGLTEGRGRVFRGLTSSGRKSRGL